MSQEFWLGFVIGFIVASVAGWFLWTIQRYRRPADAFTKPQLLMQPTSKTPQQVYLDSVAAQVRIAILRILLLLYLVGVAAALSEEVRQFMMVFMSSTLRLLE